MSTPEKTPPAVSAQPSRISRWVDAFGSGRALSAAVAVLCVLVWGPRFLRSFWVDEAGTYWMVHQGLVSAVQKTWHWPGQSLLYSAIASLFCFDGTPLRDLLLRIPSMLGLAATGYFLYRIGERAIGRGAGLVAVILFLFHPGVTDIGFQARPYPLAMAALTASCLALMEWVESRSRRHLLFYLAASILMLYLHYFFAVIFAVHALYLAYVFLVEGQGRRWFEPILAGAAILLSLVPLLPHLRLMVGERHTVPFFEPPALPDLAAFLAPSLLLAGMAAAACLVAMVRPAASAEGDNPPTPSFLFLTLLWWALPPILFLLLSRVSAAGTFVPRYMASSFPGQALLFAAAGYRLFGAARAQVWALLAVMVFASNPLLEVKRQSRTELLPIIRLVRAQPATPVFFPSILIESIFYDWRAGNTPESYLYAPLVAYPIANPLFPLPLRTTDEVRENTAKAYIGEMLDTRLRDAREVLFVDHQGSREQWIRERMRQAGFQYSLQEAGDFTLYTFRR